MTTVSSNIHSASDVADPPSTLLVFSDDWGRHPSSCQHLIGQMLATTRVGWVNTIGMRRPSLNLSTMGRGIEKLTHWSRPQRNAKSLPENLEVLTPKMWPWFSRRHDRAINQALLARQLRPWIEECPHEVTAVTTLPIAADMMGRLPVAKWVYYCVDDFGKWPGLDQRVLESMEREVIDKADVLIAAGEELRDRLARRRDDVHLLTHGVDLAHWKTAKARVELPRELENAERPWIVFWGLVDKRMDVKVVETLSQSLTQGTIVLVGPDDQPDPRLLQIDRVHRCPAVPFDVLPTIGQKADVLVMPYADLPVTRAMQPLKLLEYLATDRPVVARNLPATRAWADCLDQAESAHDFVMLVQRRLESGLPTDQRDARTCLHAESWAAKTRQFERFLQSTPSAKD